MVLYCHAKPATCVTSSFCVQGKALGLCFSLYLEEALGVIFQFISLPPSLPKGLCYKQMHITQCKGLRPVAELEG